jgi:hypothetical protein
MAYAALRVSSDFPADLDVNFIFNKILEVNEIYFRGSACGFGRGLCRK